ncbi:MAG: hypothetical protein LBS92_07760, partial [Candidatus Methanoplasma sp.]|nr:hypothetical protein [Candidatus Methanoplasma sp.]
DAGKSYLFQAVAGTGDSETIAYANLNSASGSPTVDLSGKAKKVVVTGYVGAVADGSLKVVTGTAAITATISKGAFEITVPEGKDLALSAKVTRLVGTTEYTYTGSASLPGSQVVDKAAIHFPVLTTGSKSTLEMSGSGFNFSGGRGAFTLAVNNTGDYRTSYSVTAGSGWLLDRTYTVVVDAKSTASVVVSGTYDPVAIGAGNSNLSVTATALGGNALGTYVIDGSAISPSGSTDTYVDLAGTEGASADALTGYEYMYAVTVKNNDNYQKNVTLSAAFAGSHEGWTLVVCDKDAGKILAPGASFPVSGYGSTTLYVKAMYKSGDSGDVPKIDLTLSAPGLTLKTDSKGVSISGNVATASLETNEASAETIDNSVSGDNLYNDDSEVPIAFMAVFVACILVLLFTIWAGMKRGVFVRKK